MIDRRPAEDYGTTDDMTTGEFARAVALTLLVAVVASFVVFAVPGVVGAEHSFVVLSGSMSPAIDPGDVVIVDRTDPATIDEGDVITYLRGSADTPTTHRVVGVEADGGRYTFETKGDANEESDPQPVAGPNVLGRVVLTIPYIGHVIRFANTAVGAVVLFALPLGVLALTEVRSLIGAYADRPDGEATASSPTAGPPATAETGGPASGSPERSERGDATDSPATVSIDPGDLTVTTALLALLIPYTGYVALQLQSALAFSVAFAALFSLLAVGGLWVASEPSVPGAGALVAPADDNRGTDEHPQEGD